MKTTFSYKDIWSIAFPIILGSIAQNIVNITDTAFLGHYGQVELAASAIAGVFYFAFFMIGYGFAVGTQIIVARREGEQRQAEIGRYIDNAIYFLLIFALVLFLILKFAAPFFLKSSISSPAIYAKTIEFLNYRAYGLFFAFMNISFGAFYIGTANTKVITWSNIIMAGVNIFLAYIMIFGNFGFTRLGIKGAAIANTLSEAVATLFFIIYTIKKGVPLKKYSLFKFTPPSKEHLQRLFKISSPIMLQFLVSFSAWVTFFMMVEKMGEQALAVSNIVRSIYIVLMIPIWGFGASASTLVSNLLGQKKPGEVMPVIFKTVRMCLLFVTLPVILTFIMPEFIISIYTNNPVLSALSLNPLYIVNIVLLPISFAFILFLGVSGTGKTLVSFVIETSVIILYLTYVFFMIQVLHTRIEFVWASEWVYAVSLALFSFLYLKCGKWKTSEV
ncbi:MAG: MATE family efflux transporter [Bacteroidia bacterium]|nr:MATE family efflux transporter [Bacteroidia bacterium]